MIIMASGERVASIRDRFPPILDPDEALWLDPDRTDRLAVLLCLRPYPAGLMDGYPVRPLVSTVRHDGAELVRPLNLA